jgi:hypothetical protein
MKRHIAQLLLESQRQHTHVMAHTHIHTYRPTDSNNHIQVVINRRGSKLHPLLLWRGLLVARPVKHCSQRLHTMAISLSSLSKQANAKPHPGGKGTSSVACHHIPTVTLSKLLSQKFTCALALATIGPAHPPMHCLPSLPQPGCSLRSCRPTSTHHQPAPAPGINSIMLASPRMQHIAWHI